MDWKLELIPLPVSDVDRAMAFYAEKVGFNVDLDVNPDTDPRVSGEMRIVQLTPLGRALLDRSRNRDRGHAARLRSGLHLVVSDINAARAELPDRGVNVGEVQDLGGILYVSFFIDPDGNGWTLQQLPH
jgi:predicted enzyme related to lactoylglutathione lyase